MSRKKIPRGEDETLDTFYHGRVLIFQKKKGYRFSVDAPLLASAVKTRPGDELLELGAGNGAVSLLLSVKPFRRLIALEIQESLADLARRNVLLNGLEERIDVVVGDLRTFRPGRKFDVVFSNPPYIRGRRGRLSQSREKSIAKHELKCDIFDVMNAASRLLKKNGRAYFVFPARRREDFDRAVEQSGMGVREIRFVHPRPKDPANFFLAECSFGAAGTHILRPIVLYEADGTYTAETRRIFAGESGA